jgi:hypothetical protein
MEMRAKTNVLRSHHNVTCDTIPWGSRDLYCKTFMVFNFTIKILTLDTFPLLSHSTYSPIFWLHTYPLALPLLFYLFLHNHRYSRDINLVLPFFTLHDFNHCVRYCTACSGLNGHIFISNKKGKLSSTCDLCRNRTFFHKNYSNIGIQYVSSRATSLSNFCIERSAERSADAITMANKSTAGMHRTVYPKCNRPSIPFAEPCCVLGYTVSSELNELFNCPQPGMWYVVVHPAITHPWSGVFNNPMSRMLLRHRRLT